MAASAGYSGTPLPRKLGIGPGSVVRTVGAPADFADLLGELPEGAIVDADADAPDIVVVFSTSRAELRDSWPELTATVGPRGAVWVAWPKRASKVPTDITETTLRDDLLGSGWVDVKVCAVSEIWSGLRFVLRKELRPR